MNTIECVMWKWNKRAQWICLPRTNCKTQNSAHKRWHTHSQVADIPPFNTPSHTRAYHLDERVQPPLSRINETNRLYLTTHVLVICTTYTQNRLLVCYTYLRCKMLVFKRGSTFEISCVVVDLVSMSFAVPLFCSSVSAPYIVCFHFFVP